MPLLLDIKLLKKTDPQDYKPYFFILKFIINFQFVSCNF